MPPARGPRGLWNPGSDSSWKTIAWSTWLTQRGPSAWRPSTRAIVVSSPVVSASRISGWSTFEVERITAQCAPAGRHERRERGAGDGRGVVVLDQQHVRDGARAAAGAPPRARSPSPSRPGSGRAGRRSTALGPCSSAAANCSGEHAQLVDRRPGIATSPSARRMSRAEMYAGSSTITRSPGRRCAWKMRSTASNAPEVTVIDVGGRPSARNDSAASSSSSGSMLSRPAHAELRLDVDPLERGSDRGQQLRVGEADRQVADPGGGLGASRPSGSALGCRAAGDGGRPGSRGGPRHHQPALAQDPVGGVDGRRAGPEPRRRARAPSGAARRSRARPRGPPPRRSTRSRGPSTPRSDIVLDQA